MLQNFADALQAIVDGTNEHDMLINSANLGLDQNVVRQLVSLKYIGADFSGNVWIKPSGRTALDEHHQAYEHQQADNQQRLADKAERIRDRKQQFRHDYRISVFSALIGAIIMFIAEHFQEILAFLREVLFHQ